MSNLLEQASLVMIPSGYKEDIVYSVIPTSGAGDLTFTRASTGTRIDSNGNVEVVPWNLLQQSETFDSGSWNKIQITITANDTTAPNGTLTADKIASNSSSGAVEMQQNLVLVGGQSYCASVYLKKGSGNTDMNQFDVYNLSGVYVSRVTINFGTGTITQSVGTGATVENVGDGWYRISAPFTGYAGGNYIYIGSSGDNFPSGQYVYAWGAQLNIGSTAKPYFPTTDRLNVPRLTYQNGGGGCPSLLLEKQSTNLLTYSEDFTNAFYTKFQSSITANATTSPDGTTNADKLIADATNEKHGFYAEIVSPSAGTYTQSAFFKAGEYNFACIRLSTDNDTKRYAVVLNLTTGAITSTDSSGSPTNTSSKVDNLGNGWFRLSVTSQHTSGNAYPTFAVSSTASPTWDNSLPLFTGNGTNGIYIYGAQLEASSYPTSYIPTTSTSATRVADACYKTGISSLIGQTEGVVFADFDMTSNANSGSYQTILNIATDANNSIDILKNNVTSELYIFAINGGVIQVNSVGIAGTNILGRHKIALAYKLNDYVCYLDGVQIFTDTSATVPTCSNLYVGAYLGASNQLAGSIYQAILFPTRLTNSELAQLTGNQNYTINQAYESYGVASESPNCVQP